MHPPRRRGHHRTTPALRPKRARSRRRLPARWVTWPSALASPLPCKGALRRRRRRSLFRIVHARGEIPDEGTNTLSRATPALNRTDDETRTPASRCLEEEQEDKLEREIGGGGEERIRERERERALRAGERVHGVLCFGYLRDGVQ